MIEYPHTSIFYDGSEDKQWKIEYSKGTIRNRGELFSQSIEIEEKLCSENSLVFGSCEASILKFKVANIFTSLIGDWLNVSLTIRNHTEEPLLIGRYKVESDLPTADRAYRDIVAYDAMYDIINADVTSWYNKILPDKNRKITMKQFRESFIHEFNLEEVVPEGGLINDDLIIERTIDPKQLSGKDVITSICEINGCFGHIGRDGKFHYIYLQQDIQGLYPADFLYPDHVPDEWSYLTQASTGHLYPQDPKGYRFFTRMYIKCQYEDYVVKSIDKVVIRKEENDIGGGYPNQDLENVYIIEGNFLVYGKTAEEISLIAERIYNKIKGILYRPFSADCVGNPCLEVGDPVRFTTKYELVESYILTRTLKGLQALRDTYTADGEETRGKNLNSTAKSIMELKGKTNILERTVEENRVTIRDVEQGLTSQIVQNADKIATEVARATEAEGNLSSRMTQTATEIRSEVENTATSLQSQITQNAGEIALRVTKAGLISEINASPERIELRSNRLIVQSTNFSLDENGNAIFSGTVSGGMITGSTISGGSITCGNVDFTGTLRAGGGANGVVINEGGIVVGGANGTIMTNSTIYTGGTINGSSLICSSLNGYTPITSGNISSYIPTPTTAGITAITGSGVNGTYVNLGGYAIPTGDWVVAYCTKWFATQNTVNNLAARVSALEAKG